MAKHIFVTGGVVSSLGKGLTGHLIFGGLGLTAFVIQTKNRRMFDVEFQSGTEVQFSTTTPMTDGEVRERIRIFGPGGGFIFNYRNATATYGVILMPRRDPPAGAVIEASFESPAGGPAIILSRAARGGASGCI